MASFNPSVECKIVMKDMSSCPYQLAKKKPIDSSVRLISCNKSLNRSSKPLELISVSGHSLLRASKAPSSSTLSCNVRETCGKIIVKNQNIGDIARKGDGVVTKKSFESSISNNLSKRSNTENQSDILKRSFKMRKQSAHKDTISGCTKNGNVGIERDLSLVEWSISSKDISGTLHHSFDDASATLQPGKTCSIAPLKIVEYVVNGSHERDSISWENPVIGSSNQVHLPSVVSTNKREGLQKSFDKVYSSCSFTKQMLEQCILIGPVDRKYIACLLFNDCYKMLVLVDQHAAHERIRLERFLKNIDYYSKEKACKGIRRKTTNLSPPVIIYILENELDLLIHYKKEFSNIGLRYSFMKSKDGRSHQVFISAVPAIFVNGCGAQLKGKGSDVNSEFVKEFICEQIKYMQLTGYPCNLSSRAIFKACSSYACHGAIKFGDRISFSTCERIMEDLSKCDLPFQCAHGRPSLAPIFRLSLLDSVLRKQRRKPDLSKLKKHSF